MLKNLFKLLMLLLKFIFTTQLYTILDCISIRYGIFHYSKVGESQIDDFCESGNSHMKMIIKNTSLVPISYEFSITET